MKKIFFLFLILFLISSMLLSENAILGKKVKSKLEHHLCVALIEVKEYEASQKNTENRQKMESILSALSKSIVIDYSKNEPTLDVLIKTTNANEILNDQRITKGVFHKGGSEDFVAARIKVIELEFLTQNENILGIEPSYVMYPELDDSVGDINADDVWEGANSLTDCITGEGVYVGIIDGYPLVSHITFEDENGDSRIIEEFNYGIFPSSDDHGTHVGGIAAGRGDANGNFRGIAYESELLFGDNGFGNVENMNGSNEVLDSFQDMINKANNDDKPLVVNLSAGQQIHPHDGSTFFEEVLNEKIENNIIFIKSAGNDGDENVHFHGTVPNNDIMEFAVNVPVANYINNEFEVEIWYDNGLEFDVRVKGPNGNWTTWLDFGLEDSFDLGPNLGDERVQIYNSDGTMNYNANNNDNVILLEFYRPLPWGNVISNGDYSIELRPHNSGNGGQINAYSSLKSLISGNDFWSSNIEFPNGNFEQSISLPGYAEEVITVAAMWKQDDWPNHIANFSSKGPSRTGTISKPDITAPGVSINSSIDTGNTVFDDMSGTSMAAPHVTGCIALLLQNFPDLTASDCKTILQTAATSPGAGFDQNEWGAGKLDILEAYKSMVGFVYGGSFQYKNKFDNTFSTYPSAGLPIDVVDTNWNNMNIYVQDFTNGAITYYSNHNDAYWIGSGIWAAYSEGDTNGNSNYNLLGIPLSSEYADQNNNTFATVDFENGKIYWDGNNAIIVLDFNQNIDVAFILDRSGSMIGEKISQAKNAASQFVQLLNVGDEVGVCSFSSDVLTNFPMTEIADYGTIVNAVSAINGISAGGGTDIGIGIARGQELLNSCTSANYPQGMLLLSDGQGTMGNVMSTIPDETDIYTIGLGSGADELLLSNIAYFTGGDYCFAPGPGDLVNIFNTIMNKVTGSQQIANFIGFITSNREVILHDVFIDPTMQETTFALLWQNSSNDLDLELIAPDGTVIDPTHASNDSLISFSSFPATKYYRITLPQEGQWTLKVIGVTVTGTEEYVASVSGYSNLELDIFFDNNSFITQDTICVKASLAIDGTQISGASVEAEIETPSTNTREILGEIYNLKKQGINDEFAFTNLFEENVRNGTRTDYLTLYDDGNHGDGDVDDGIYGNYYSNTAAVGSYSFNVTASGTTPNIGQYSRQSFKSIFIGEAPEIDYSSTLIDFGDVFITGTDTLDLVIYNTASNAATNLEITNISTTNSIFQPNITSCTIPPQSSEVITISFSPTVIDSFECDLIIESNDPDEHSVQIILKGNCVPRPDITVNPLSFTKTIYPGVSSSDVLTIGNIGEATLDYTARVIYLERNVSFEDHTIFESKNNRLDYSSDREIKPPIIAPLIKKVPNSNNRDCTFTIDLYDDYGDGWNGGSLDVLVNSLVVLDDITLASGYGPESIDLPIATGDLISTVFTGSGWPYECSYFIYDNDGVQVASDGTGGVEPTGISPFFVTCTNDPTLSWLTLDGLNQVSGSIDSGSPDDILSVLFDTVLDGLTVGIYEANIEITCNDPDNPEITLPVTLTVIDYGIPENVTIEIINSNVCINWDEVLGAMSYKIYASDNLYGTFTDVTELGMFNDRGWCSPIIEEKKFYYVTALICIDGSF